MTIIPSTGLEVAGTASGAINRAPQAEGFSGSEAFRLAALVCRPSSPHGPPGRRLSDQPGPPDRFHFGMLISFTSER